MNAKLRELRQAIQDADIAFDRVEDELDTVEDERDALEKERDQLLEKVGDLLGEINERDARIAALEAEANDLTDRLLEVDSSL